MIEYYLSQIEKTRELNSYVEVFEKEAKKKASELDLKYQQNPDAVGKLFGLVVSLKDVLCYKGHSVTAGSKILEGFHSIYSATAVQRLLDEDAIIIGRVNCDEFAMGSTNETSCYGVTRNAANPVKVPGGSSGGSAVSVQADTCMVSLGSDTGGSVRQPAAFCGIIGFKPTYGRISRYGLLAYASSFDQIGILANSVDDVSAVLEVISGKDDFDSTCSQTALPFCAANVHQVENQRKTNRIAFLNSALENEGMEEDTRKATLEFIEGLRQKGHIVEPVDFELLEYLIPAYYVMTTAEASSNLSRYDGIRFGYRSKSARDIHAVYKKSRTEGFGKEVKRRIMLGTFVLSAGFYEAYYSKAQKIRRLIHDKTLDILKNYDFILLPASPMPAWDIGKLQDDPVAMYLADVFTVQANMVGLPAISLPVRPHHSGLPLGIQFMANKFEEEKLLAFAKELTEQ
jgi:aspartyl-tRNA(Asn)/glutamyl-tRNA(Gln) amidotransferase subunit A